MTASRKHGQANIFCVHVSQVQMIVKSRLQAVTNVRMLAEAMVNLGAGVTSEQVAAAFCRLARLKSSHRKVRVARHPGGSQQGV